MTDHFAEYTAALEEEIARLRLVIETIAAGNESAGNLEVAKHLRSQIQPPDRDAPPRKEQDR